MRLVQFLQRRLPAALWLLTVNATGVLAQERSGQPADVPAEDGLQQVIITGSRIARSELDRLQPTTVIAAEKFDERGYTDVGQALSELPQFGIQPSSAVNTQSAFGIAQSFVDLYSLGSQRTLTLVNGRRFVSENSATFGYPAGPGEEVDLNVIPTKLIDHVDTVSVGGAPIYGSDAIAGTVNIILKKDYQGVDVDAQTGASDQGDAWNYRLRGLAGTNFMDGRGNVTGAVELNKSDGLVGNDRKDFASNLAFIAPASPGKYTTLLQQNTSIGGVSTSGIPLLDDSVYSGSNPATIGVTNTAGQPLAFAPGSSALQPYNPGVATGNGVFWQGGDGARLSQFSNLLAAQERINADLFGNFKVTDQVSAFAEAWFSEDHATNLINQPAYNTALFSPAGTILGNFLISARNPYLSAADQATIQSELATYGATKPLGSLLDPNWDGQHIYLARANTDLQSGVATGNQVVARGVFGLNGDFSVFERDYNWEVAANYGYSRNISMQPSYVFQNVQNALNATLDSAGNIVCAPGAVAAPVSTGSSTCAPLNVFGQGSPSAAAKAYITHDAMASSIDTQRDITANLGGEIMKLPAGEWKAEAGYENRRESAKFDPDSFYTGAYGQNPLLGIDGAYRTNEVYAETLVPVISPKMNLPLLNEVELEGAARHVDNSIAGTSTTWTAGLRWSPVEDLQFRGNKTRSIRAPSVTELFLPASIDFEFAEDPCDKNFVNQGTAPATRAANCAAAGINTSAFSSNVVNATGQGITSGSTKLQSETADSKTFGVVLRPRWVEHLNVSLDYVEINVTNAIEQLKLVDVLDACYDATDYPTNPSCSEFTRNAQGQVTSFHDGFVNAGILEFQGITAALDYALLLPPGLGRVQFGANYLDTRKLTLKVGSASAQNLAGELSTFVAQPKGKGSVDINYQLGRFSWYLQGQYTSGMNFDNNDTATSKDILRVNPWWVVNSTVGYEVLKSLTVRLIVNNVFDKQPPFPALGAGTMGTGGTFASATSLYFPGIIGRTYLLSVNYRF